MLPAEEADKGGEGETAEQKAAREAAAAAGHEGETEEQRTAREAEEAANEHPETADEKTAREAAEAAAAEEHPELAVVLPPDENRGEKPITIDAPDQEVVNRLNRLNNEAAIGRQVKQERRAIERQFDQLEAVEDLITLDPAGFVLDRVDQVVRPDVAMHLLFEPGMLEAVQERLEQMGVEGGIAAALESPETLRVLRAELKAGRLEMRETLREKADQRRTLRAAAARVSGQIDALIPEHIVGEQRDQLYEEARRDIVARAKKYGVQDLDAEDVALFVGRVLRQHEIAAVPARSAGDGKPATSRPPVPAARTGAQFTQGRDARQKAAAAAPAGAGAPAAKPRPTLPPTTDGRIAYIRQHGLRAALGKV